MTPFFACFGLKMEVIGSSETAADFYLATLFYIQEDRTLHNHRSEDLKSNVRLINVSCFAYYVLGSVGL
jgi:hypothetical protein